MKYILILLLLLIPTTVYTKDITIKDALYEIDEVIAYERNKIRYVPPLSESETQTERGKLLKQLSKFEVGFRPVITVLPGGIQLPVGVIVSSDRRYVRIGLSPMFSSVGAVHTFNFAR